MEVRALLGHNKKKKKKNILVNAALQSNISSREAMMTAQNMRQVKTQVSQ